MYLFLINSYPNLMRTWCEPDANLVRRKCGGKSDEFRFNYC